MQASSAIRHTRNRSFSEIPIGRCGRKKVLKLISSSLWVSKVELYIYLSLLGLFACINVVGASAAQFVLEGIRKNYKVHCLVWGCRCRCFHLAKYPGSCIFFFFFCSLMWKFSMIVTFCAFTYARQCLFCSQIVYHNREQIESFTFTTMWKIAKFLTSRW